MSEEQLTARIQAALAATSGKSEEVQVQAVKSVIEQPSQNVADNLWQWVVGGLVAALGIALIGLIVLICLGKSYAPVLTAFTGLLSGIVGLFVQSPVANGEGSGK